MSAHLMCVTSSGGLPVFTRKKGSAENLPFSVIGSLNGVHLFSKTQNIKLLNTLTEDYSVVWQEFEESFVLIAVSTGCTVDVLNRFLSSVFNAITLIVGLEEIKSQRNVERLKRELKICYPIIDRLLESLDCGATNKSGSDIIGFAECILCPENHLIQIMLDSYTECVDSIYSCILIHGKIAAATESWWTLHPEEIKLLSLVATCDNTTTSKDVPVFLPFKSPSVAFRLVACTLIPDVQICSLCGPTPSLEDIEHSASQCFKSSTDILTNATTCFPRNFPAGHYVDEGILGLLLLNTTKGKYMISKNPQQNLAKKVASSSHRLDILRTFFYQSVAQFLITNFAKTQKNENITGLDFNGGNNPEDEYNIGKETYWCSEYHKCYSFKSGDNILCVLFNSTVPTPAMRLITQKTLKMLIGDKQVCW